jgi:hypothetical protein
LHDQQTLSAPGFYAMLAEFPCAGRLLLQVVNGPKTQLGTIQDAVITQGNAVKSQINGTISGARGSVNNLKGQVVGQLSNVEETYKPVVRQVDGYR